MELMLTEMELLMAVRGAGLRKDQESNVKPVNISRCLLLLYVRGDGEEAARRQFTPPQVR